MEQQKVDMFIATTGQYYPQEKMPVLRDALQKADDSKWLMLSLLQPKNPTTLQIVSIFGGWWGIDRFMLGDVWLGVLKLITSGGFGIWWLIDLFIIRKKTRDYNYNTLQAYL